MSVISKKYPVFRIQMRTCSVIVSIKKLQPLFHQLTTEVLPLKLKQMCQDHDSPPPGYGVISLCCEGLRGWSDLTTSKNRGKVSEGTDRLPFHVPCTGD